MKVLLINPSYAYNSYHVPKVLSYFPFWRKFLNFSASSIFPPLNLALLAAYSPPDVDVKIMDGCIEPIDYTIDADLVGITSLTGNANVAYQIADRFRAQGRAVVMGGSHPTALPDEALDHCDTVAVGEADETWPKIIEDFRRGRLKPVYEPSGLPSMDNHPLPRRDLLKSDKYFIPCTIQTSRGCPYDCNFCSVTSVSGSRFRTRPIEDIVAEIQAVPARTIFFVDDIINGHPRHARELMEALVPRKKQWGAQATLNIARDKELLRLAFESGCKGLFIGLESFSSQEFRKLGGHRTEPEKMIRAIRRIREAGIAVWGSFVIGLDTDTGESIRKTVELAIEAQLEFAQFCIVTPLPGTRLRQKLLDQNRVFSSKWQDYSYGNLVFQPTHLTLEEVSKLYPEIWKTFYSWRSIRQRLGGLPLTLNKRPLFMWGINLAFKFALSYSLNNSSKHDVPPSKIASRLN